MEKLELEKEPAWLEMMDGQREAQRKALEKKQKVDGVDGVKTVGFKNINDRTVWIRELGQTVVQPGEQIWLPEDIAERLLHESYFRMSFERVQ